MKAEVQTPDIIDRVLSGEKTAFRTLIHENERLVRSVVFKLIRNEEDRQDLCQEVFMRVYQNLERFEGQSKLSTWIARIAYNTCLNHIDKKRVPLYGDVVGEDASIDDCAATDQSPAEEVHSRQKSVQICEEIDQLPVRYGIVLTLYHLQDMSYEEIGNIMSLPDGTVKSYLFRARQMLKKRLMERYHAERGEMCA